MTRLVILGLVAGLGSLAQAGMAQAVPTTAISTTITSPSDPSYYLDSTGGATGSFTVSGTSTGLDPSSDTVNIDCFVDDDNASGTGTEESTLVSDVPINSSGSFSTQVPYSAIDGFDDPEFPDNYYDVVNTAADNPDASVCRLRAIPTDLDNSGTPSTGLSDFAGPRVLLAYLALDYGDSPGGTSLTDYTLVAPQLGATDVYESLGACGLTATYTNDQTYFGDTDAQGFNCADTTAALFDETGGVEVDGNDTKTPFPGDGGMSVSVSQNQTNGDITAYETDPLYNDDGSADGVQIDRTIQQTDDGNVVLITDKFVSTDDQAHQVILNSENEQCFLAAPCGTYVGSPLGNGFVPPDVSYDFPGSSGYLTYPDSSNPATSLTERPGTILIENNGEDYVGQPDPDANVFGSITYFTTPYDYYGHTFPDPGGQLNYTFQEPEENPPYPAPSYENAVDIPYAFEVMPSTPISLSFAYTTDSSQDDVNADVTAAADLQASGENVGGTPPTVSSTTTYTTPTPAPTAAPATGSASLTNIESAQEKAWVGPTYHPIANTLGASRRGHRAERLSGSVAAGSAGVTYYFQYGTTTHYGHRTKTFSLAPGESLHSVTLTATTLHPGKTYHYRIVAAGTGGQALGADRTFTAGQA